MVLFLLYFRVVRFRLIDIEYKYGSLLFSDNRRACISLIKTFTHIHTPALTYTLTHKHTHRRTLILYVFYAKSRIKELH